MLWCQTHCQYFFLIRIQTLIIGSTGIYYNTIIGKLIKLIHRWSYMFLLNNVLWTHSVIILASPPTLHSLFPVSQ